MVYGKLLYQIYQRLNEMFSPLQDMSFGGKSVLVSTSSSSKTSVHD